MAVFVLHVPVGHVRCGATPILKADILFVEIVVVIPRRIEL